MAPSVSARLGSSGTPLLDQGALGGESASAMLPRLPRGSRPAVAGSPSPDDGDDPYEPGLPSPSALRKMILAPPPAHSGAEADEVAVTRPPPVPARPTTPAPPSDSTEVNTGSRSADESTSAPGRRPTLNSGLRWTVMRAAVVEGANLLGVVVLARLVGPADFGRYAVALIVLLLSTVPTWAIQYTIVQRDDIDCDHLKTGQTLAILMGLAMCALCVVASQTVVPVIFGARTAVLVRLMIPACFLNSINTVQYATLSRRLEFRRLSLIDMTTSVVGTVVTIPLAVLGLGGAAIVLGVNAGSLAGFILICCWILPPIPNFRLRAARDFARSGIPAASNAASLLCFENCDYVIVGARVGALQAGYYFRAYTLGVVYQTKVSQVITTVGLPVLSRVRSEAEVQALRQRIIQTITMVLFPLLTALAIVAPKFVTWLYGPAWRASVLPVQILTFGGAAMLVAQAVTVAMLATGRPRAVMLWGWGHFIVYGAAVFAAARLGLPAVAIAAVIVHTTFLVISYIQLHHGSFRRAAKALTKDILPAAIASAWLAAVAVPVSMFVSRVGMPILPYLLSIMVAGGAGYFVSLRLWFPTELRELAVFAGRLLPARAHRVVMRWMVGPQTQSVA